MSTDALPRGSRIGAHELVDLLGESPTGRRYAARIAGSGERVEVTVLNPARSVDAGTLTRDIASISGRAVPGLVPVVGGGVTGGHAHVVSTPLDGRPLADVLAGGGLGAAAVDVLRPVAEAVDALHNRGVVLRSLTPASVIVDQGGRGWLRYTGAAAAPPPRVTPRFDQPVYTAPEQRTGSVVSHRTDLYSFACLAYATITGAAPFTVGRQAAQAAGAVPSVGGPGAAALDDVFRRALAPVPTDRPPSAAAFLDELVAAFGHRYRPRAGSWRRRLVWVVAALVLVDAAIAVLVVAALRTPREPVADASARWALKGDPIAVGADPLDVEAGDGFVWASGSEDGSLTRIDPATGATARVQVGGEPGQIVVADGAVWIRNLGDRITRVDTATLAVSPPVPGGGGAISGMAVGGGYVWLSHRADNTVTRVDVHTLTPSGEPIGVGSGPLAMEFADGAAFVVNGGDGTLSRIDATTATVTATARVGESVGGIEVDGGVVYVAADDGVVPVPVASFVPARRLDLGGFSYFVVHDGTLFVVYDEDPRIQRVAAATGDPVGDPVRGVGAQVGRARFAFDRLWMTDPKASTVLVLGPS